MCFCGWVRINYTVEQWMLRTFKRLSCGARMVCILFSILILICCLPAILLFYGLSVFLVIVAIILLIIGIVLLLVLLVAGGGDIDCDGDGQGDCVNCDCLDVNCDELDGSCGMAEYGQHRQAREDRCSCCDGARCTKFCIGSADRHGCMFDCLEMGETLDERGGILGVQALRSLLCSCNKSALSCRIFWLGLLGFLFLPFFTPLYCSERSIAYLFWRQRKPEYILPIATNPSN